MPHSASLRASSEPGRTGQSVKCKLNETQLCRELVLFLPRRQNIRYSYKIVKINCLSTGKSFLHVSQTILVFTPKYSCIRKFLISFICRQNTSECFSRKSSLRLFDASPIISSSRTTASIIILLDINLLYETPRRYSSMLSMASSICLRYSLSLFINGLCLIDYFITKVLTEGRRGKQIN